MKRYTQEQLHTIHEVVTAQGPDSLTNQLETLSVLVDIFGKDSIQVRKQIAKMLENPKTSLAIGFLHDNFI